MRSQTRMIFFFNVMVYQAIVSELYIILTAKFIGVTFFPLCCSTANSLPDTSFESQGSFSKFSFKYFYSSFVVNLQ